MATWATIIGGGIAVLGSIGAVVRLVRQTLRRPAPVAIGDAYGLQHTRIRTFSRAQHFESPSISLLSPEYVSRSRTSELPPGVTVRDWEKVLRRRLICPVEIRDAAGEWTESGLIKRVLGVQGDNVLLEVAFRGEILRMPADQIAALDRLSANDRLIADYSEWHTNQSEQK